MTNWDPQYCPTCGAGQVPDAYFCGNCGTSFQPAEPSPAPSTGGQVEMYDPYALPAEPGTEPLPPAGGWEAPPLMPEPVGPPGPSAGAEDGPADRGPDGDAERRTLPLLAFAGVLILAVTVASPALLAAEGDQTDEAPAASVGPADITDDQVLLHPVEEIPEGAFFPGVPIDVVHVEQAEAAAEPGDGDEADGQEEADAATEEVVDLTDISVLVASLPQHAAVRSETTASLSEVVVSGTEPGVFSGQRRTGVCDRDALLGALSGDGADDPDGGEAGDDGADGADGAGGPDGADAGGPGEAEAIIQAYIDVLGVESDEELDDHVRGLTTVRLRSDTRVTHHSLVDGAVLPTQVVLQAGTGVMIDDTGVPRVSCNGGSPLSGPAPLETQPADDGGFELEAVAANHVEAWDRLDPSRVVTIESGSEALDQVLFADMESTDLVERPVGTNGSRDMGPGDLIATLEWESPADLDLSVVDPNEATISAERPSPENSKGRLDQDANAQCQDNMAGREEISWPDGDAPEGDYSIRVSGHAVGAAPADSEDAEYEADCGDQSAGFTLTIRLYGQEALVHEDSVSDSETKDYTVVLGDLPEDADADEAAADEDGEDGEGSAEGADGGE